MILQSASKILVAHRRLFENDHNRYFIGTVEGYDAGIARVSGFTWIRDAYSGTFERKGDQRVKILSLSSGTLIVYQLPSRLKIERLAIRSRETDTVLCDDTGFEMDLTETVLHHGTGALPHPVS